MTGQSWASIRFGLDQKGGEVNEAPVSSARETGGAHRALGRRRGWKRRLRRKRWVRRERRLRERWLRERWLQERRFRERRLQERWLRERRLQERRFRERRLQERWLRERRLQERRLRREGRPAERVGFAPGHHGPGGNGRPGGTPRRPVVRAGGA